MPNDYHPITLKITDLLKTSGCWYETFEHEPVRTSEDAAKVRSGYSLNQGAKALIMSVKSTEAGKRFVMLVIPGNLKFDNDKVRAVLNVKHLRFASEKEVVEITGGVLPGGVPPFGSLFGFEVIADAKLFANEKIIFNAGDRSYSVGMFSKDYKTIENPKIESISN
jgi:Ala-tRNA(Pro) deacylase